MGLLRQLQLALRWPVFAWVFGCMYWGAAIGGALYKIKWLNFRGPRNDVLGWALGMKALVPYRVLKIGSGELYRGNCVYLINHRSWADMLVDQIVTEGRAMFMSRWAMIIAFTPLLTTMAAMRTILLFKRGTIADKDGFNKWIDRKLRESPQTGLVVYPEGHRNTRATPLPLKRGMLYYAYSRKLPVQIIHGRNKEAILSEKGMVARLHQTVAVAYSGMIESSTYETIDAFFEEVQRQWDALWAQVFDARLEGLPELQLPPPDFDYPMDIRLKVALCVLLNILLLGALGAAALRCAAATLALLPGPLAGATVVLAAAWVAASFILASRPVDALALEEGRARARGANKAAAAAAAAGGVAQPAAAANGKDE